MAVKGFQAGRLRHRVTVQRKVETRDAVTGAVSHTWDTLVLPGDLALSDIPAECLTGPGRELQAADAKQAATALRVTLRYFPGLTEQMRVVWEGRAYDIQSIERDRTARHFMWLRCGGGLTDGA